MNKLLLSILALAMTTVVNAANKYDNPDTIVVAQDGSGEFKTVNKAIEVCRAFMSYHKVIFVKKGIYREKVIIPSWLTNIELLGEDRDKTIITYDDHANREDFNPAFDEGHKMGTFRSYTLKIEGTNITLKNITIENSCPRLGQSVALHTEGTRLLFINCRFLGNQDTVYTGQPYTYLYFKNCYIDGTTDFIFGPSTAWFEGCTIMGKINSYITAASTPKDAKYGYIFNNCKITVGKECKSLCLGRPWRPYAYTLFMNCDLPKEIKPEGWYNWGDPNNEKTARYMEYNNRGKGAQPEKRVAWAKQLTKDEAAKITPEAVFNGDTSWIAL